ncbi:MAG: cation transporter [Ktedonobacteraceae bacterium]|nr:cation transporter [Ktedonobacteraceae bacterium]
MNQTAHVHTHAGHDHTHGMVGRSLRIAFFLTIFILLAEIIGGLLANSLALLSDAGHVVTDLFALGLAWFASAQAERPSNERKTFGYHRVGILAALLNALTLILLSAFIIWEAIQRFQHPEPVQPLIMFVAAGIGVAVNLFIGFGLRREGGNNLNVRAATLHVFGDVGVSLGVIIAGLVMLFTGWSIVDPLLSIAVAVLMAAGCWNVLRETTDILLEAVPKGISLARLVADLKGVAGVRDVHDLHVWSIASGMHALSCHVIIDNIPPSASSSILRTITDVLNHKYRINHSTIQFECTNPQATCCSTSNLYCRLQTASETCCDQTH